MKKITLLLLLLSLSLNAQIKKQQTKSFGKKIDDVKRSPSGHIKCASVEYEELLRQNNPKRLNDQEFENWLAPLVEKYKNDPTYRSETGGIITIPVVVHVIHNGDAYGSNENIRDEQVESQITVLNQDFRRMAGTPGFGIGVDTQIQFALAKVDPNGNPTNGIDRINLCREDWNAGTNSATLALVNAEIKPQTIWNATDYLNMWSVNFGSLGLLGYAQFPSSSGLAGLNPSGGAANTDGVVSNYGTFGSRSIYPAGNYVGTQYDKGRTMTHEVGHWVGLRHLWGDGDCNSDDYCNDTPNCDGDYYAGANTGGCIAPIQCSGTRQIQNYMDYSDDSCMSIYTQNQKDRMVAVFNNSPRRVSLKTSTKDIAIPLFANDAEIKIENACDAVSTCTNPNGGLPLKVISLYNRGTSTLTTASISYNINGGTTYTNNWSGSLAPNKFIYITLANTAINGTLNASITAVNGATDQRTTNNNASKTFSNTNSTPLDNYTYTSYTFNLIGDPFGAEITWQLTNQSGMTLYSGGPYTNQLNSGTQNLITNQIWNLPANGCYTFTIFDSFGDGMAGSSTGGVSNNDAGSWTIKANSGAVTIASGGGNYGDSESYLFSNNALNSESFDLLNSISLYPNPTNSILNISIPVELNYPANYEIYNNLGQVIKSSNINSSDLQINTSEFTNGIYFIKMNFENNSKTLRFIKN
ncbi:Por secretion system C-terminal sorting domain-containing protein [Flavobacterium sp. 9AF]|uniref:M43 family zinc metalloprotease n=1 Tax=Flavobacterium sp. 9AF TaxID=2653142 RepID=UPI0012F039FF|nr:M43 family zinc metalloprotease [Flavobacterium sp. 9AF]VXB38615.1 Por secretion system C-terminal sorting domain-containing protein [Flavobacterium sp. 9AF]